MIVLFSGSLWLTSFWRFHMPLARSCSWSCGWREEIVAMVGVSSGGIKAAGLGVHDGNLLECL